MLFFLNQSLFSCTQFVTSDHLEPIVPLGLFNFKDDSIPSVIKSFHAMLEKVLQSEKNESLKLDDNFQVKIKLLGMSNMTHIRKNKERILKRLNIENHGDDNCNSIVGTIKIPNDFNFGEGTEDILKNQCLTLSIIWDVVLFMVNI